MSGPSRTAGLQAIRHVKPLLSVDQNEARSRVINLYKAWYRQIPQVYIDYEIPKTPVQCRQKLKDMFMKHKDIKDLRVIDTLVIRGQMELQEVAVVWKQNHGIMAYWKEDNIETKPKDFLGKFLDGQN